MRAHVVENGVVVNSILVDDLSFQVPGNQILINGSDGGIGWLYDDGQLFAPQDRSEPKLEDSRMAKLDAATAKRWEVMTGGLTLPSGVAVGTTIDDQNRITSVVANAALAGLTDTDEVDFKAASGWVRITIGQVKEIAGAIGQFVQACYSAERQHHEAIALLDPGDFDTYDLDAHWPPTDLTAA